MSRRFEVAVLATTLLGCVRTTPPVAAVALPATLPPAPPGTVAGTLHTRRFEPPGRDADYSSDRGLVHLRIDETRASGAYPNGVITCTRDKERLDCEWMENGSEGRASFIAGSDGGWNGTWGNGASATDGGSWTLARIGTADLDGVYDSNWGPATVQHTQKDVHVDYSRGTMDCQRKDDELACSWTEGSINGGAELRIEPNGVLRGRWGSGASSTDGGAWVFVKR